VLRVCYRVERGDATVPTFGVRIDLPAPDAAPADALKAMSEANFDIADDAAPLQVAELVGVTVDASSGAALLDVRLGQRRARVWAVSDVSARDGSVDVHLRFAAGDGAGAAAVVLHRNAALARAGAAHATVTAGAAASRLIEGSRRYAAAMPCRVIKVHAQVGAVVRKGEPLFELESMKMQTTYGAEEAGTVKRVGVTDGSVVAAGTPIVDVAPSAE
jgi:biotin carboxyl carrier protein